MLALTRKLDEGIMIDGNIEIKILGIQGDKVKIGIKAPKEVTIYREEIYRQIKASNEEAIEEIDLSELSGFHMKSASSKS